jgi:plasmid stabilization system protein ParE
MLIRWTQPAADDITRICDYTQEHFSPAQARRVALVIYETVESLSTHPNRGRSGRKANTRELVLPGLPFLIVYRTRRDGVEIMRILHGAQQWP